MKTKINSLCKSKYLVMYAVVLITFLSSCTITTTRIPREAVNNVKSVDTLKENKILAGRFICYVDGNLVESKHLKLILKKEGERRVFKPDDNGFVFVSVPHGKCYIEILLNSQIKLIAWIYILDTDWIVNFGTFKLELKQSVLGLLSKMTPAGIVANSIQGVKYKDGSLLVTQTQEWNDTRNYVLSQLNVPPQLIRDERIPDLLNGLKID